jgi:proteic killer suppression protein
MIGSFRSAETAALFAGQYTRKFQSIARVAQRKLKQLNAAGQLSDLMIFPGNRLEALRGNRVGQHSIRINDQYRICFVWKNSDAHEVEIVDYH